MANIDAVSFGPYTVSTPPLKFIIASETEISELVNSDQVRECLTTNKLEMLWNDQVKGVLSSSTQSYKEHNPAGFSILPSFNKEKWETRSSQSSRTENPAGLHALTDRLKDQKTIRPNVI